MHKKQGRLTNLAFISICGCYFKRESLKRKTKQILKLKNLSHILFFLFIENLNFILYGTFYNFISFLQ